MKKVSFIFLILSIYHIKLDAVNLELPTVFSPLAPIIKIGKLNGKPAKPNDKLVKDEFKVFSASGSTIRVNQPDQFPQNLKPGQRIALFLNELDVQNYYLRIAICAQLNNRQLPPELVILFNGKVIWKHKIQSNKVFINAVIPSTYLEKGSNVLQIRNQSLETICFDWLQINDFSPKIPLYMVIDDLDRMPYPERKNFNMGSISISFEDSLSAISCLNEKSTLPLQYKLSIPQRRKKMPALKSKIIDIIKQHQGYKHLLSGLWKQLNATLNCGKEPVLSIKGKPSTNQIKTIANLCREMIYYWRFEKRLDKKYLPGIIKCIKENIPVATIATCSALNGTVLLDSMSQYNTKNAIFAITKNISDAGSFSSQIWGEWSYRDRMQLGEKFQKKNLYRIAPKITEWFWSGGSGVVLKDVIDGGRFFDDLTLKPIMSFYALARFSPLFQYTPQKLICNVVPMVKKDCLENTFWTAANNADGIITIQIASTKDEFNKPVQLLCPVPFSGNVTCEITTGVFKKKEQAGNENFKKLELKTEIKEINIKPTTDKENAHGIFEYNFELSYCTTIRLIKKGANIPLVPKDLLAKNKNRTPKFKKGILKVVYDRSDENYNRTKIRWPNGMLGVQGGNYKGTKSYNATRSLIGDRKNIVPWSSKSTFVEIAYPNGRQAEGEGVRLYFGKGPKVCREFSFWVYPKSKDKVKKITLQFYLTSAGGNQFLAVDLKPEMWQRVIMPSDKVKPPYWGNICVVGNPKLPEYKDGNKISFEFNGFCVFSKPDSSFHCRVIKEKAKSGKLSSMTVLFLGRPGKVGVYRHSFKHPVEFKKMSMLAKLPDGNKPELTYLKNAQLLEIKYKFPKEYFTIPDAVMNLLTKKEKELVNNRAFLCTGVKLKLE